MREMGPAVHRSEARAGVASAAGCAPLKAGRRAAASLDLLCIWCSFTDPGGVGDAVSSFSARAAPSGQGGALPGEAEGLCVQRRPAPHFRGLCPLTTDRLPCSLLQVGSG